MTTTFDHCLHFTAIAQILFYLIPVFRDGMLNAAHMGGKMSHTAATSSRKRRVQCPSVRTAGSLLAVDPLKKITILFRRDVSIKKKYTYYYSYLFIFKCLESKNQQKRRKYFALPLRRSLWVSGVAPLFCLSTRRRAVRWIICAMHAACGRSLLSKVASHTDRALPSTVGFL